MADTFLKFTGHINRRLPKDEGDYADPVLRENWLSRDGRLQKPEGNESVITGLSGIPRWMGRYHTLETGNESPKSFVYTEDGVIHVINDQAQTSTVVKQLLNQNAYPQHWIFKTTQQNKMFFVDGVNMYSYDGNNDNTFLQVDLDGFAPIDVIEHKDRLCLISRTSLKISKRLDPENFDDANDSLEVIVGSGKGVNLALRKIEDRLYILNSEGIFVLEGDVISALASTFEIRLVDERRIISARTSAIVEKAIVFLADDYEIWSFNGDNSQMLSYNFKLKDFVNDYPTPIKKAVAVYHDNYYKLSFVEKGETEPNIEIWWDAFENKIEVVRGRHVSCYMKTDPSIEREYLEMGQSDVGTIVRDGRGYNFRGSAITTKLRTRDITLKKGHNVRVTAFYPQFEPTGNRDIVIRYLLDGRLSNPSGADAHWNQNLRAETKTLGMIEIKNQSQATWRVRPKIDYARGESIAFEIEESTLDLRSVFLGIGIDYTVKDKSKGVTVGA